MSTTRECPPHHHHHHHPRSDLVAYGRKQSLTGWLGPQSCWLCWWCVHLSSLLLVFSEYSTTFLLFCSLTSSSHSYILHPKLLPLLPSPPVTRGPPFLYICLSDSSAGSPGQLKGGVAAISRAPLMCYRVRQRRRRRKQEDMCVSHPRWSRLLVSSSSLSSSVPSRCVVSSWAPNGFLMTARRHQPHARSFISISTERPKCVRRV